MSIKNMSMSDSEYLKRITDTIFSNCGDIEEWKEFLKLSKERFNENWNKPFIHQEKLCDFNQVALLGSGNFGDVILIKQKDNGTNYAMKAIEKEKIFKYNALNQAKNEKMILQCINFPFTVYLVYFFTDNSYIYMVMPLVSGGELFMHLKQVGQFSEVRARFYISQVVLAIEYLHYLDLIYRDIKPENLVLDHIGYLKVTDFGHCKRMTNKRTYTLCGTPEYLAPEIIMSLGYGKAVDWWAIGVLTYELIAGCSPFYSTEPMQTYENIVFLKYSMPSSFSAELKDLVRNMLQKDLTRRYGNLKNGVDDIKCHKWFQIINWMAILNKKVDAPFHPKCTQDTSHSEKCNWIPKEIAKENLYAEDFANF